MPEQSISNQTIYTVLIALIAAIPSLLVFVKGLRTEKVASEVRVYTVYDKLLEQSQADNEVLRSDNEVLRSDKAALRQQLFEVEQNLRECLNQRK